VPLRTRIILIFGAGTLLLLLLAAAPFLAVQGLQDADLARARGEAQAAAWTAALADAATAQEILSAHLAADPALVDALLAGDAPAVSRLLLAVQEGAPGLARIDVLAGEGRVYASSAGLAAEAPLIGTDNLRNRVEADPWLVGIEAGQGGRLLLVVTSGLRSGQFLSVAAPAGPVLDALLRDDRVWGGARAWFLVDRAGALLLSTDDAAWPALRAARAGAGDGAVETERAGRSYSSTATPLRNTAGLQIGTLVSQRDVTAAAQRRSLVLLLTGGGAALTFTLLLLGLHAVLRSALDPLSSITGVIRAMAAGDTASGADLPDRRDEVGEIAAAVEVFRRDIVALARAKLLERMRLAQQQALIRREMERLAGTLDAQERDALAADLRGIEAAPGEALADGFKLMAGRVMAQHARLADLLAERTRDLEVVRQALSERAQLSRLRQELEVARHLQLSSLPQVFPPFPDRADFEVYAAMAPAKEVGGDFYDFALLGGDRLAVMIGDASGKGVPAAMFIAMARSILRSAIVRGASPGQALALANGTVSVENHTLMFATVFAGVLDLRTGWLTYASAGHNPPYLVGPAGGVMPLSVPPGTLPGIALGILEEAEYDDQEVLVPPGASLVLFTDGVTEAHDPSGTMFGEARLEAGIAGLAQAGPEGVVAAIQAAVLQFAAGAEQADDITVLSARFLGGVGAAGVEVVAERVGVGPGA